MGYRGSTAESATKGDGGEGLQEGKRIRPGNDSKVRYIVHRTSRQYRPAINALCRRMQRSANLLGYARGDTGKVGVAMI